MSKILKHSMCLSLVVGTVSIAHAMAVGPYFGLQIGQSNTNNEAKLVYTGATPPTVLVTPENKGISERLLLFGYQFNNYGAFELGYTHYSPSNYKIPVTNTVSGTPQIRENGVDIMGKLIWPVYQQFSIFGKAGITLMRASSSGSLTPPTERSGTQKSVRPTLAVGASYDISQSWQTDLTYTYVLSGGGVKQISFLALGLTYHFVDYYCGQFLC